MAVILKKKRLFNPQKPAGRKRTITRAKRAVMPKAHRKAAAKPKRRNPGALITLGALNPQRKTMKAKSTKPKKRTSPRPNPFIKMKTRRAKRRSNPSITRGPLGLAKSGAIALLGLVATRQIPQLALQTRNTGLIGYAANFATAALAGAVAGRFWNREAGKLIFIGGSLYTVSRIITEQFSPVGKYFALSGVGDAQAASLGVIKDGYFPVPVVLDQAGQPIIPRAIVEAAQPATPPAPLPAPTNMSGLSRYGR
ncbi:MAG: hypothetical protein KatS3mg005_4157 [Bryobacteraceae bacterium]|nr:MAG: hypothetical protein KatS3mg005_4157 [Bryobacteraceae bacterium]